MLKIRETDTNSFTYEYRNIHIYIETLHILIAKVQTECFWNTNWQSKTKKVRILISLDLTLIFLKMYYLREKVKDRIKDFTSRPSLVLK